MLESKTLNEKQRGLIGYSSREWKSCYPAITFTKRFASAQRGAGANAGSVICGAQVNAA
jgi:hypothetical protein